MLPMPVPSLVYIHARVDELGLYVADRQTDTQGDHNASMQRRAA